MRTETPPAGWLHVDSGKDYTCSEQHRAPLRGASEFGPFGSSMRAANCPICGARFDFDASAAAPFCSARCRQIDLKRWLGEEYSVPVVRNPDEDEGDEESPMTPGND